MFAVVTGGGTSGHVMPALAVLDILKNAGYTADQLAYVGARRGIETRLLADADVDTAFLPISGLQRSMSLRSIGRNIVFPFRVVRSRWMASRLMSRWKPSVVVSVGGYASDPMAWASRRHKVPLVCVSYDRIAGLATRRQAEYATACAVAFADTQLPRAVVTGAPVRHELRVMDVAKCRPAARDCLGIPQDAVVVTVMGGSLGSAIVNTAVPAILSACSSLENVFVYHICGERFIDGLSSREVPPGIVGYTCVGYETRMADVYASTDLVVARAGASTVAEIATVGVASILVPWSGAADNHQQLNAEWLALSGAAYMATEADCADGALAHRVAHLVAHADERAACAEKARKMGEVHRGDALLTVIQNAAR